MKCVWCREIPYNERANAIQNKITELEQINLKEHNGTLLKSLRKLKLDIYYPFSKDLDSIKNWSKKWKQLILARDVVRLTKDWDRNYKIDLSQRLSGEFFIEFFGGSMDTSKHILCSNGINYYRQPTYTFKTFIVWAVKMKRLGFIGREKLNSFLATLEDYNNGLKKN